MVTEATEQLSAVVGVPKETPVAVHPVLVFADTATGAVMVGLTLSVTVTTWVAVAVLPDPSVTVQVTVVLPNGNTEGALLVTEATVQLSPVVGVPNETPVAVHPVLVVAEIAAGAVMVGFELSLTVTVAVHVEVLPSKSVTVSVTVLAPVFAQVNELGETVMLDMPQLSEEPLLIWAAVMEAVPEPFKLMLRF